MPTAVVDFADLAISVQAQTTAINNFKNQFIDVYTTTNPTVTITDANGNAVIVESWYATIGANAATVSAMQAQVTANTAAIAAIDTGDTTIQGNITTLQNSVAANLASITTINTQITAILAQQTTDKANITTLQSQVASLQSGGTSSSTSITSLQTQVTSNTTAITNLQTQQTTDVANITTLTTDVGNNTTAIATLQTNQTADRATLAADGTSITALQGNVTTLQSERVTDAANIATNTANISTNASNITSVQSQITVLSGDISTNTTNITSLQTTTASLGTSVSNLSTSVSTVQTNVANNTAEIATNTASITTLNTQVANLPQPGAYSPPYVSNRFFTQVFMDVNGRLLGGISRKNGKLWMNNGGWLSERLDTLEAITNQASYDFYDASGTGTKLSPPTYLRYKQLFGSITPNTTGSGQNISDVMGGISIDGGFELNDGTKLINILNYITAALPPSRWNTPTVGSYVALGDKTLSGVAITGAIQYELSPSQTSTQLAARLGVSPVLLSVTNRQILMTGSTTVSASMAYNGSNVLVATYPITVDSPSQSLVGTLGGVLGTLTRGASDSALTFVPLVTLSANVFVGDNIPFIPQDGAELLKRKLIFAVGRNNITDLPAIQRDINNLVNGISTRVKNFLIVTPFNVVGEDNTTVNGKAIIALEEWVAFTYPKNVFNTRQFLQSAYAGLGAADAATYYANGLIPASYFNPDNVTLTTGAVSYFLTGINNIIQQNGW